MGHRFSMVRILDMKIFKEFWTAEAKRLSAERDKADSGSIQQWVANVFYLAADHQVRLLREYDLAVAMLPSEFYQMRVKQIAGQFDKRLAS